MSDSHNDGDASLSPNGLALHERLDAAQRVELALDAGAVVGTWFWDVAADIVVADERFAHSFGLAPDRCRAGLALGVVMESIHPEDHSRVSKAISQALTRPGDFRCEYRVRTADGAYRWIEARGRVECDETGRPLRFPGVLVDVDERRRAQDELARANGLLRAFMEAVPGVIYAKDRQGRLLLGNRGTAELIGRPLEAFVGKTDLELLNDAADAEAVMRNDRRVMEAAQQEELEERVAFPDGRLAWWHSTKAPLFDEDGQVIGLVGMSVDITQRREADAALRRSEARLRLALAAGHLGDWTWDAATDVVALSPRAVEIFGRPDEPAPTWTRIQTWLEPSDAARAAAAVSLAVAERSEYATEYRVRLPDGRMTWVSARGVPVYGPDGASTGMVGVVQDVTDSKRAEEQRLLLLHELNHRVKNTLAVVQGLAWQTFRGARDPEQARRLFEERLTALARAHDRLTEQSWLSADLAEVVADQVKVHQSGDRIRVRGPALHLGPKTALSIAMALHELGTNAAKYGALSNGSGEVALEWSVDPAAERLKLRWAESGGPPVQPPRSRGFGSRLLEQALARELDGAVTLRYLPTGVVCEIDAPVGGPGEAITLG